MVYLVVVLAAAMQLALIGADSIIRPPESIDGISTFNYCGSKKAVALSFDGGFSGRATESLLDDLKKYDIQATFFLSGPCDEGDCVMLKRIVGDGHEIQHHSWSHPKFTELTTKDVVWEIAQMENFVENTCGIRDRKMVLFRPPFGDFNPALAKQVNNMGYTIASWTFDSDDYEGGSAKKVFSKVVRFHQRLPEQSGIILLHHDHTYTKHGIRGIIGMYKNYFQGYEFITANECFRRCLSEGNCQSPVRTWPGVWTK